MSSGIGYRQQDVNGDLLSMYELDIGGTAQGVLLQQIEVSYYKKTRFKVVIAIWKIWKRMVGLMQIPKYNRYTPLW